jgi:cbb3-type cytochrome oxidase subunit 3
MIYFLFVLAIYLYIYNPKRKTIKKENQTRTHTEG